MNSRRISRRQFLGQATAAGCAGPLLLSGAVHGAGPNDRINLGFIGVGTMGGGHVRRFLGHKDVQIVAICDVVAERRDLYQKVVEEHYGKEKEKGSFKGCKTYKDFREVLARDDIDAVVIATPDHWHAIPCVLAANAKKDIYCEKPLTHSIAEGRKIVDAVKKNKIVFQTGSQQRSEFGGRFRQAVELVRNGAIGTVKTIRIGVGGPPVVCNLPEQPIPDGTDWDLWQGPAPKRGYNEALCPRGVHKHFPAWRNYKEYAGGGLADMGAHHFDIAQWALDMDNSGPVKIEPPDGKATTGLKFTYASGVEMFHGGPTDCVFEGSDGTIMVSRGKIESNPEAILKRAIGEKDKRVYLSNDHAKNWVECLRNRKDPICTAEIGHRSATICHLAAIGYDLRRALKWDPEKEQFVGDDDANKSLDVARRDPWKL
ncbi:MAG: Gfo/Idh/MocA family oxidoreductase [Gemmataceae bacterium]|nr:Gfo/Idh/MocA family oxidoreductase [Gemmataceae bacterium]